MSNRKGGAFERELLKYLREGWELDTERLRLAGKEDEGDLLVRISDVERPWQTTRLVIEAKNVSRMDLAGWIREAELEANQYAAHRGITVPDWVVVHKAKGKGTGRAYVTTTLDQYLEQRTR